MAIQPDNKNSSSSASYTYGSTFAFAIFVALMIIVLYSQQHNIGQYFTILLWVVTPLVSLLVGFGINMVGQKIVCGGTSPGHAIVSALPLVGFLMGGMGLSQISYLRAPITSLFVQIPDVTVIESERKYPTLKGFAVAYYAFFGVLFGQVLGSGLSQVC
jgi:hypothetical protein